MIARSPRSAFLVLSLLAAGALTLASAEALANGSSGHGAEAQAVDNGQPCVVSKDCVSGFCVEGVCCNTACGGDDPKDCQACSVKNGATQNGVCGPTPNGKSCDDGNLCTPSDVCLAGICTGTGAVACVALDACHVPGACQPATGTCSNPSKADGAVCNDGNACTKSDSCQAGVCTGASPVDCPASDQCHDAGVCDAATGACSNPGKPNGTSCDDGDACTKTDVCQFGACTGGTTVSCNAIDQCHDAGTCDKVTGACSTPPRPNGSGCDDGNACTRKDTCQIGACIGDDPVVCVALDACHLAGTCSAATGVCSDPTKADGTACDDGNVCNTGDRCIAGSCEATSGLDCDDNNPCTADGCDVNGACTHNQIADGIPCSDQDACTKADSCQAGVCKPGPQTTCELTDCLASASCDPTTGGCVVVNKPDGEACPGGICTGGTCLGAAGAGGASGGSGGSAQAGNAGDAGTAGSDAGAAGSGAGAAGSDAGAAGSAGAGTAGMGTGGVSAAGNASAGSAGAGTAGASAGAGIGGSGGAGVAGLGGSAGSSGDAGAAQSGQAGQTGSAGQTAAGQAGAGGSAVSGAGGRGANGGRDGGSVSGDAGRGAANGAVGVNGASFDETIGLEGGCVIGTTPNGSTPSRSRPWAALGSLAVLGAWLLRRRPRG